MISPLKYCPLEVTPGMMALPPDTFAKPFSIIIRSLSFGGSSPSKAECVATITVVEWLRVVGLTEMKG